MIRFGRDFPAPRSIECPIPGFLRDARNPIEVAEQLYDAMRIVQDIGAASLNGKVGLEVVVEDATASAQYRDTTGDMVKLSVNTQPHPYAGAAISLDAPKSYADVRLGSGPSRLGARWLIGQRGVGFRNFGYVSRLGLLPVDKAELGQLVSGAQFVMEAAEFTKQPPRRLTERLLHGFMNRD